MFLMMFGLFPHSLLLCRRERLVFDSRPSLGTKHGKRESTLIVGGFTGEVQDGGGGDDEPKHEAGEADVEGDGDG